MLTVRNEHIRVSGKLASILALLLLRANEPVPVPTLASAAWEQPTAQARSSLHVYMFRLRKLLGNNVNIETTPDGYMINAHPDQLDLNVFKTQLALANASRQSSDNKLEQLHLGKALSLWRGDALATVPSVKLREQYGTPLDEQRVSLLNRKLSIDISTGRSSFVLGELFGLVTRYPFDGRFAEQLMTALSLCGRTSEALDVFMRFRTNLVKVKGIEPSESLARLHHKLLK